MRAFVRLAVISGGLLLAGTAGAQQQQPSTTPYATQPVYTAPPPPASAQAGNGEYVAPMQQQTQQIYVPQSVAMSGPREIGSYEEGDPIPPGYHPDTRVRRGLVIGGAVTFGVMYLLSALTAAVSMSACSAKTFATSSTCTDLGFLLVPVAGPFIEIAHSKADAGGAVILVIDGIAQAGGVAMLILGIALPKTVLVRNDLALGRKETVATFEPVLGGTQNGFKITF